MIDRNARRRILVVDDDLAILELVRTRLRLAGYDAFNAHNGQEALALLATERPEAMVLDLNMPRKDGFGVLEAMGPAGTKQTPTLVLTARHGAVDVKRAVGLGARDYLSKPFTSDQLLKRVARLVRRPSDCADDQAVIEEVFD